MYSLALSFSSVRYNTNLPQNSLICHVLSNLLQI